MTYFMQRRTDQHTRSADSASGRDLLVVAHDGSEAVLYKPAGLSSERGHGDAGESLITLARSQFKWPDAQLPHRLDRPTRGLVVISRDSAAAARHALEMREHRWTKWYVARIPARSGAREAAVLHGEHKAFLKREGRLARVVRAGGDPSRMTVLAIAPATNGMRGEGGEPSEAHALIRLDTGRFHQIRVMFAALGFPLIGDMDYGGTAVRSASGLQSDRMSLSPRIDLEAIALRIDRQSGSVLHHMRVHAERQGVGDAITAALDEAFALTGLQPPNAPPLVSEEGSA